MKDLSASLGPSEFEALDVLRRGNWKGYVCPGGALQAALGLGSGAYSAAQFTILGNNAVALGGTNETPLDDLEVFRLHVRIDPWPERADEDLLWRPPRALLTSYPVDLELEQFLHTDLSIAILSHRDTLAFGSKRIRVVVDSGLLATTAQGKRMLLTRDHEIPMNIVITTSTRLIEQVLNSAIEIEGLAERTQRLREKDAARRIR